MEIYNVIYRIYWYSIDIFILFLNCIFCTHSLESNASNIQRSLRNECFPVDSNVKIAKNTGPLRHSKKNLS
jgi:hypothetical protein